MPISPGDFIGRYVVLGKLGSGGMGTVLKAYDESLDRAIAIKLLHSGTTEGHAKRLTREAQALAKLSHPNVVHVYEVGKEGNQWFIAMELVRGQTLREWQRGNHDWSQCVQVYRQAGAGLMAAHAAGLVHRDFKPDNCIIDDEGRPMVLDFGIVRDTRGRSEESLEVVSAEPAPEPSDPLTRAGSVLGTLAYMPLEQLNGEPADERSDQFSFCVSLYEAVYGERPFDSESVGQLTAALTNGEVRPAPKGTRVPGALRSVLLRGLSRSPDERWPSMEALLAELRELITPRSRLRGPVLVLGGGLMALGFGLWSQTSEGPSPCQGARDRLEGVWDEGRREAVEAAILATELSYAAETWVRVDERLRDYATAWADKHTEVCEATNVRKEQSVEVMDLRMECLRERLVSLRESVDVLMEANDTRVREAARLAGSLPSLSRCDDIEALRARFPPPEDPAVAEQVEALRDKLERSRRLETAGEYQQAFVAVDDVSRRAEALDYAPLIAEAMVQRGSVHDKKGEYEAAEHDLRRGYSLAAELGHDTVEVEAATSLTWVVGERQGRHQEGLWWGATAQPLSRGPTIDPRAEASALLCIGRVLHRTGQLDESLAHYRLALAIWEREFGPEHLNVSIALNNISLVLRAQSKLEEALAHQRRSLSIIEAAQGPGHPSVAALLNNMGEVMRTQGDASEALSYYERALTLWERALGPDHPNVAAALNNISLVQEQRRRFPEALAAHRRARAIFEKVHGPEHPNVAKSLANSGAVLESQGKLDEALAHYRRARVIFERALGPEHLAVATIRMRISNVLLAQDELPEALEGYRVALAIREAALDPGHPEVAHALQKIGNALARQGQLADAQAHYARALAIWDARTDKDELASSIALVGLAKVSLALREYEAARTYAERAVSVCDAGSGVTDVALAESRFTLARALWTAPGERVRARQLAEQARQAYADSADGHDEQLAQIDRWLAEHRP